ncbi:MAG: aldehyde dehydrogenase family protein, partial [Leptospiraceae bacterium]|nr:aldehyde dehydrogenase family protein [Leptospiraceae bacterium]
MALDKKRIDGLFERQRAHRKVMRLTTSAERIEKLNRLKTAIEETKEDLYQALYEDYRKPKTEADLTEVVISISEINYMVRNLAKFMRPVSVESPISLIGARSELRYEPRGSSLIIAPWNYPMQLSI